MRSCEGPRSSRLLLATTNRAKLREYRELLRDAPCELVVLREGALAPVEEKGETLEQNAVEKALAYASRQGCLALADDSGLEVEALGGEPGVLSARYAGEGASDEERIALLLARLEGVPHEKRQACFRCVIAIASPQGKVEVTEGKCEGLVAFQPAGKNGFGYDPVFYLPELGMTMAELSPEKKNLISHRARAARQALEVLKRCCDKEGS